MKLKTKITLALIFVSVVAILTMAIFTAVNTKSLFDNYIDNYRETRQQQWSVILQTHYIERGSWSSVHSIIPQVREHDIQGEARGRRVSSSEQIFLADANGLLIAPAPRSVTGYLTGEEIAMSTPIKVGDDLIGYVYLKIIDSNLEGILTFENHFIRSVFYSSLGAGLVLALLSIFVGIAFGNRLIRPLSQLTKTTGKISEGEWDVNVESDGNDEISELAQAFNVMTGKLKEAERARKTLVADVAHELRNPLATLRAQLESIQEGVIEATPEIILSLNDEVIKLGRLVNDLQDLSLVEVGKLQLKKEKTDVGELIKKITNIFNASLGEKDIKLILNIKENIKAEIDPYRINQVVVNLLANAVRHTPSGKNIVITLKEIKESIYIEVYNEGSKVSEEDLPFIFQRFYRADKGRAREQGGTGLGLAITKGLVMAHNGDIGVENTPDGVKFFIALPKG